MAGIAKDGLNPVCYLSRLAIFHRGQQGEHSLGIFCGVERSFRMQPAPAFLLMPLAFGLRVFFLQFGGVQQHNPGYFRRGVGAVYLASEAIAHQLG
jgi:hypothetical protein